MIKKNLPAIFILIIVVGCVVALLGYILSSCNVKKVPDDFFKQTLVEENAYVLSDGAAVSAWKVRFDGKIYYKLSDGTELLSFIDGGHSAHAGGYNSLNDVAKKKIDEYYAAQPALYSVEDALEAAYADYLANKEDFTTHPLHREVYNSYENSYYLCQITELITPAEQDYENVIDVKHLSVIFDRATGEVVSPWSLFKIPEEQAKRLMIDQMGDMYDKELLLSHIDSAQIQWYGDHMQIEFFAGTIPGMTMNHSAGISAEQLAQYLTEKALEKPEQ